MHFEAWSDLLCISTDSGQMPSPLNGKSKAAGQRRRLSGARCIIQGSGPYVDSLTRHCHGISNKTIEWRADAVELRSRR